MNVLFIMADELRADVAYHERYPFVEMPNLDRLRREGATFTQAFCNTPTCVPSRASVNTGMYPHQLGIMNHQRSIPPHIPTWGKLFADAGYDVPAFGKTHGQNPGFEPMKDPGVHVETLGTTNAGNHPFSETITGMFQGEEDEYYEFRIASDVRSFLESRDRSKPFAAHVGFLAPHPPFYPPKRFVDLYDEEAFDPPEVDELNWRTKPLMHRTKSLHQYLCHRPEVRRRVIQRYCALCTLLDEALGRILDALEATDVLDETLIAFTADHGDQLGDHDMMGKFWNFYEGSLRVPLVIRLPEDARKPQGERRDFPSLVELVDVMPTLLDFAGLDIPDHLAGRSLGTLTRSLVNNPYPQQTWRDAAFCETENGRMLRTNRWKLCHYSNDIGELYDLSTDPGEENNLYESPDHREIRRELTERLLSQVIDHPSRYPL